jgi:site-specific DNA-methyltransferase (adenine-specific)
MFGFAGDGNRFGDSGGAARFFPCFRWEAKASTSERPKVDGKSHSTVKPVALLRWLCKLVCPPGGIILDCFSGTGTTGQAARAESFPAILIDNDPQSIAWTIARLDAHPKTEAPTGTSPQVEPAGDLFDGMLPFGKAG